MRKSTLLKLSLAMAAALVGQQVSAQQYGVAPRFSAANQNNNHKDYVGARFSVTQPAAIMGSKAFTTSNDGSGTGQWGRAIDSVWIDVQVIKAVSDTLGCSPLLNGSGSYPSLAGKWALVFRGNCQFSDKALAAQNAGAKGCIIVNNVPGGPVGMAAGTVASSVTIPVLMVSDIDGLAMAQQLNANQVVKVTLTPWGLNYAHDLGFIPDGQAGGHAYSIPYQQLPTGNGNPVAYKAVTGGFIGNFGTATSETGVVLKNTLTWTPTGGSPTTVAADSVTIPTFLKSDSIMWGVTNNQVDIHATGTGRFDANYTLRQDIADQFVADNSVTVTTYVTDSIYSKGRYDFTNYKPVANVGYQFSSGAEFAWGPLYYIAKGGYSIRKLQFTCSQGSTSPSLGNLSPLNILIFRWTDGVGTSAVKDSVIQSGELEAVGVATKTFSALDSGFQIFTVDVTDPNITAKHCITRDDSWYWVAASVPSGVYLGCDGKQSQFPRTFTRFKQSPKFFEFTAPIYQGTIASLITTTTEEPFMQPFDATWPDSTRFAEQKKGLIPAIPLHMSKTLDKQDVKNVSAFTEVSLFPNPATENVNVKFALLNNSSKVWISVLDGMGKTVYRDSRDNMKSGTISVPTGNLATGNYYLILNVDGGNTVKKFTVNAK